MNRFRATTPGLATIVISVFALAGLITLLYPNAAAWMSQFKQSQQIIDYQKAVSAETPARLVQARQLAAEYNAGLIGEASVGADQHVPTSSTAPQRLAYDQLLSFDSQGLMGRIRIPRIDLDLPIYHGTSEATLLAGVGHLEGTALPIGGNGNRSVLTAHRGLASATLFTELPRVKLDDTLTLTVSGETLTYKVVSTQTVAPEQTEKLLPERGRDLVTLVTCTPLGVNTHRILVTGERVHPTPEKDIEAANQRPEIPRFPWWAVVLGGGLLLVTGFICTDGFQRRRGVG